MDKLVNYLAIIAFIVSIITIFTTNTVEKMKIRADIKAKSRIKWIQEVRELTSELLTSYNNFIVLDDQYFLMGRDISKDPYYNYELSKINSEIMTTSYKLMLYFSPSKKIKGGKLNLKDELSFGDEKKGEEISKKNSQVLGFLYNTKNNSQKNALLCGFIKQLSECTIYSSYFFEFDTDSDVLNNRKIIKDYFFELQNIISIYLKIEWDIAKKGK